LNAAKIYAILFTDCIENPKNFLTSASAALTSPLFLEQCFNASSK